MAPVTSPDVVRLGRYGRFVRRQWPVLLVTMALGGALGMARFAVGQHTYTSSVTVLVPAVAMETGLPPPGEGPYALVQQKPPLDTMDTEAQLVRSGDVLASLRTVPGFHVSDDALAERVTVTAPPNSRILTIHVRAESPGHARAGARAVGRAFVKLRTHLISDYQTRNRQAINRRIAILDAELKTLPAGQARVQARTRGQALQRQIMDATKQLSYLDQFAQVLRSPERPVRRDARGADVDGTTGVGLGLLGGLLVGLYRDRRPRRLRYARDVRRRISLPVLAEVRREGIADAGRRLRNLAFAEDARTVLVSGLPGETADPVAVSLASAFAHGGAPTTLLRVGVSVAREASARARSRENPPRGRRSEQNEHVSVAREASAGTGEARTRLAGGEANLADAEEQGAAFRVEATSGAAGDRDLVDAVERAHQGSGVVVISGPPLTRAEAGTLAALADLTMVTVGLRRVTDRPLTEALAHLDKAGAPPCGIVIT
jgi:capsular polysaccharide biosynthesis protein